MCASWNEIRFVIAFRVSSWHLKGGSDAEIYLAIDAADRCLSPGESRMVQQYCLSAMDEFVEGDGSWAEMVIAGHVLGWSNQVLLPETIRRLEQLRDDNTRPDRLRRGVPGILRLCHRAATAP